MKNRKSIFGKHTLPSLFTAVTVGFALSAGGAVQAEQEEAPSEYRVVAWDPATGSWTYLRAAAHGDQYEIQTIQTERQRSPYALERDDQQRQPMRTQQQQQQQQQHRQHHQQDRDRPTAADRERMQRERPAADRERSTTQQQWREALRPQEREQRGETERRAAGRVTLEGQVQGFREVRLRRAQQMPEEHTWIRLTMASGYDTIVDIGREKDLTDLDLERGDRIRVTGRHATISGQNVLIADRIRVGRETINIEREKTSQEVSGTIRDYEEINIDSGDFQDHLVVRFEMEDGREVVAALSKDTSLDELEIEEDSEVTIQGERAFVEGRPILVARKIKVEGEQTELRERSSDREN